MSELEEIKKLLQSATPGPWRERTRKYGVSVDTAASQTSLCAVEAHHKTIVSLGYSTPRRDKFMHADAALIARAPELAAEVIRLRVVLDKMIRKAHHNPYAKPSQVKNQLDHIREIGMSALAASPDQGDARSGPPAEEGE